MAHKIGTITVQPKQVSWVGLPIQINESERLKLLEKDIFLYDYQPQQLAQVRELNTKFAAYIFNLDRILQVHRQTRILGRLAVAKILVHQITSRNLANSIVHSTSFDQDIIQLFKDSNIGHICKDLQYKNAAWQFINIQILNDFYIENRSHRDYVRLLFHPNQKIKIAIKNLISDNIPIITATLKDLSINSLGFRLDEEEHLKNFQLKDALQISVLSSPIRFNLATCFLTRMNKETRELSVNFKIDDDSFINKNDALELTRLIYSVLKETASANIAKLAM